MIGHRTIAEIKQPIQSSDETPALSNDVPLSRAVPGTSCAISDCVRTSCEVRGRLLHTDLPESQATRFNFAINLKTAKALGLQVPDRLLARVPT